LNLSTHKKTEVDLRVAQELKNNQDFIYQTNQSLQSLSQGIISLSLQFEKSKGKLESDHKALQIKFENLEKKVLEECDETGYLIADYAKAIIDLTEDLTKKFEDVYKTLTSIEDHKNLACKVEDQILSIEKKTLIDRSYTQSAFILLKAQLDEQNSSIRKDLEPKIPEVDPIQKAFDERFKPIQTDINGFIKEVGLLKKAVTYAEKKFENIYTLIERLKEGKK